MNTAVQDTRDHGIEHLLEVVDVALAPLSRRLPSSVSREDLASAGRLALAETLARYEGPSAQLRARCFTRVRWAMLDELRRLDPLSRRTRARVTAVRRAAATLTQAHGREATDLDVASATGLPVHAVREAHALATAAESVSADEIIHSLADDDGPCPAESAESGELAMLVREALVRLSPRQAHVVRRYHLEEATLETIALELGVSKERVRQLREAGEKQLRSDYSILALWQTILTTRR